MSCDYVISSDNLTREQLRKYNVSELQVILDQLNLPSNGKKHELVERLYEFWQRIQTSEHQSNNSEENIVARNSLKFNPPPITDFVDFRSKLEIYGPVVAMLYDPSENAIYITFRGVDPAKSIYEHATELSISNISYIEDIDVEKKAKDLHFLASNLQPHNTIQKTFRKTNFEPRLYWLPANVDEE